MEKIRSLFDKQEFLDCIDLLEKKLEKRDHMKPKDNFDYTMMYGISMIEYGLQYAKEFEDYHEEEEDYEIMVKEGFADAVVIPEIVSPEIYYEEALEALFAAQQILTKYFPSENEYNFTLFVHIIRCEYLLESNNLSSVIDNFIQFCDKCGESRWNFEKYPECLSEILEFCQNDDEKEQIKQELAWFWRERYCEESQKKRWYGIYTKFGTGKEIEYQQEYEKYM